MSDRSMPDDTARMMADGEYARSPEQGQGSQIERRRQIVEAAHALLSEGGLEALTVRAVLGRTGLARRAFYECFDGKDDLVLGVFEQTIQGAADRFAQYVQSVADPFERLRIIVTEIVLGRGLEDDHAGADRRGAALSREHLRLAQTRPDQLQRALQPLIALIAAQLSDGMRAGTMRQQPPQRLAMLVYNLVATTVQTELLAEEAGDAGREAREELARELWEFCRGAVSA